MMRDDLLLPLVFLVLVTAVLVVVIWQAFVTWRAKAALAREQEFRRLAERATTSQEQIERQLADISAQLGQLNARHESLERILKEVE